MSPTTPRSRGSSRSFAATSKPDPAGAPAPWEIRPSPSRLLAAWHLAVHALAVVSVCASGISWPVKLAGAAIVVTHAFLRRPAAPMPVCRHADGAWSLPALGLERLALRPGTAVGPFWARLALGAAGARTVSIVLLADQLDPEDWRRLRAVLRRAAGTGTV